MAAPLNRGMQLLLAGVLLLLAANGLHVFGSRPLWATILAIVLFIGSAVLFGASMACHMRQSESR